MKARPLHLLAALPCLMMAACEQNKSQVEADTTTGCQSHPAAAGQPAAQPVSQFKEALAALDAKCPQQYPEIVTPLPDSHDFEKIPTAEVMKMLESWNPALREMASKALADRGTSIIAELKQGTQSDNHKVRAGSATALASICKAMAPEDVPKEIVEDFMRLMRDEVLEVRVAALQAMDAVAPQTREATLAVLAMCDDPDDYLAQDAKITLEKRFAAHSLPIEEIEAGLKKAMQGSLPRGRGHIVNIIAKLKPKDQERFVPELIAHLDWYPRRDTMFAAGGQAEAIKLLTKLHEKQLVERLPKLMNKVQRGDGLFSVCLQSARAFGPDAKIIVPELKAILKDLEKNGKNAKVVPRGDIQHGIDELKQTYIEIDSL